MRALFAAGAVGATAAAFSLYVRVGWPWFALGWVALVPWLALLDRTRSAGAALAAGVAMSAAFVLAVFPWFAGAIASYSGAPAIVGFAVVVLVAPLLQPQLVGFAAARHLARRTPSFWQAASIAACAYVGIEWAWTKLFGDTIGHGFLASRLLRQGADLVGAGGLTFLLVMGNECAWETIKRLRALRSGGAGAVARRRVEGAADPAPGGLLEALAPALSIVAVLLGLAGYGALRLQQLAAAQEGGTPIKAALVQANVGNYDRMRAQIGAYEAVRTILDDHFGLSLEAVEEEGVDLLVWPETVYPTTFSKPKSFEGMAFDREISLFVARVRTPLLFGTYDTDGAHEYNAAVLLDPDPGGQLALDTYRKSRLFLFTERVPAFLESDVLRGWLPWLGTWKAGAGAGVLPITLDEGREVDVAPLICLDDVDPSLTLDAVAKGADVIVTISHDGWFSTGAQGPWLHHVVAVFRSLESRRPQLRATNTGVSTVITPAGDVTALAGVGERSVLIGEIVPADPSTRTLMTMWGDWFGGAALAAGAMLSLAALRRRG